MGEWTVAEWALAIGVALFVLALFVLGLWDMHRTGMYLDAKEAEREAEWQADRAEYKKQTGAVAPYNRTNTNKLLVYEAIDEERAAKLRGSLERTLDPETEARILLSQASDPIVKEVNKLYRERDTAISKAANEEAKRSIRQYYNARIYAVLRQG